MSTVLHCFSLYVYTPDSWKSYTFSCIMFALAAHLREKAAIDVVTA